MKKIFTLLATALMAVTASAADNLWEVTSADAIAAETTLIDNDVLTVKNVFATKGVTLNMFVPSVTIKDHTFQYSIKLISGTTPDADNPNGTEYEYSPDQTTLVADVKKKTTVTAYYAKQSQGDFKVYNQKDFSSLLTPSAAFEKAGDFYGNNPTWGTVEYDLEPGTYLFFSTVTAINLYGLSWTSEGGDAPADDNVIYSWSSTTTDNGDGTTSGVVSQRGGTATAMVDEVRVNYANKAKDVQYYTICLCGKKGDIDKGTSAYVEITLDKALEAGDKIDVTAFRNKNESGKNVTIAFIFGTLDDKKAEMTSTDQFPNINADGEDDDAPGTQTFTVPEAAAGCKTILLTRGSAGTNLFITKFEITRGSDDDNKSGIDSVIVEDENAPVEYYNLQGVRIAEPAAGQIVIRRQGSKVEKLLVR